MKRPKQSATETLLARYVIATGLYACAFLLPPDIVLAQAATQNINLNATVADYCAISGSATGGVVSRTISVTNGAVSTASLAPVTIADVACSAVSDITLTTTNTGLTGPSPTGGFQNVIHYWAAALFGGGGIPILDTSSATSATAATGAASVGQLTVVIAPQPNTDPMVAGAYADVLVVTLTPQ